MLVTGDSFDSFSRERPHIRPHLGHREPKCPVPAFNAWSTLQTPSSPIKPHPRHRGCVCFDPMGTPPAPMAFPEDPLALFHRGDSTLSSIAALQTPSQSQRTPHVGTPRVRSHLKLHPCPSNPICITEGPPCHVPMRGLHLNGILAAEGSLTSSPWW